MGCSQCIGLEAETQKWVLSDVANYRKGRQSATTRMLLNALRETGVEGATLLDIGGGIGEIPLDLLRAGAAHATTVEISSAYLNAASLEAARAGLTERITPVHGDFVALAGQVPPADIVTLNRVVCCYPDYPALVEKSMTHARQVIALVLPRDWWIIRQGLRLLNAVFRLQKSLYVAYIHPVDEIDRLIQSGGFKPAVRASTLGWLVWVYTRGSSALI